MTLSTRCQTFDIRDAPSITQTRYNVDFQAHYKNNINNIFQIHFYYKIRVKVTWQISDNSEAAMRKSEIYTELKN